MPMAKKIVKIYDYHDATGNIIAQTVRFDPKDFRQRRPYGSRYAWGLNAGWYSANHGGDYYPCREKEAGENDEAVQLPAVELVLYRLPEIIQAVKNNIPIYICEGEKDADNLHDFGFITTTCSMGSGKWKYSFTESLKGCKQAVIIADKDEPGRKHAESVATELASIDTMVKIIEMPDINGSSVKDFSDWQESGGTKDEFNRLVSETPLWQSKNIEQDELLNELIMQRGAPFYTNKSCVVCAINESFWAGLHNLEHIQLYEPNEKLFYDYANNTGIYQEITEHIIKQEISSRMLQVSRDNNLPSLERQRKNSILSNIVSQLKGITEKRDAFSKKEKFVHLGNGIVNFRHDGQADFIKFSPHFYSRNRSPILFNPNAKCERFLNELLLPSVSTEDAVLIQKYVGLCLLGINLIQRFVILHGEPERGKTTISEIIQLLVGLVNVTELRTQHLSERFELFRYRKKTLLVGVDVPGKFLSEKGTHVIKGLVGGDSFDAEQKGGTASFQFPGTFCIIITSNSKLQVRLDGDVGAWRRRLLLVRFNGPLPSKKIPGFAQLLIKEEGSGILNWALRGLAMLLEEINQYGDIVLGESQKQIIDALLAESDSLRNFLLECVEKDDNSDLSVHEIVEAYAEYCPIKEWNPKPITVIHRELESLMLAIFQTAKAHSIERYGKSVKGYRRIRLKNPEATL